MRTICRVIGRQDDNCCCRRCGSSSQRGTLPDDCPAGLGRGGRLRERALLPRRPCLQRPTSPDGLLQSTKRMNIGPVLTGRSLREMTVRASGRMEPGYGLAVAQPRREGRRSNTGGLPGYKSRLLIDPSSKVTSVVLIHTKTAPPTTSHAGDENHPRRWQSRRPPEPATTPEADLGHFGDCIGAHWRLVRVVVLGGKLRRLILTRTT
jgi:hypothetical protein